jgi:hypothetical protein
MLLCCCKVWTIFFFQCNLVKKESSYFKTALDNKFSFCYDLKINYPELWLNQWREIDSTFSIEHFSKQQDQKFNIQWHSINDNIVDQYKDLFEFSIDSNLAIDIYSYGTVLELKNNKSMVSFSGDMEVEIVNFKHKEAGFIYHASTYEMLQDCFWINSNEFIILGCTQDSLMTPFIWKYNLKFQTKEIFYYRKSFKKYAVDYFFQKFPKYTKWSEH